MKFELLVKSPLIFGELPHQFVSFSMPKILVNSVWQEDFDLLESLGVGGFGEVFRAQRKQDHGFGEGLMGSI